MQHLFFMFLGTVLLPALYIRNDVLRGWLIVFFSVYAQSVIIILFVGGIFSFTRGVFESLWISLSYDAQIFAGVLFGYAVLNAGAVALVQSFKTDKTDISN